jgi:hypothetical protein
MEMKYKRIVAIAFYNLILIIQALGQMALVDIDWEHVPQQKLHDYVLAQQSHNIQYFYELQPSSAVADLSCYIRHKARFKIKSDPSLVWEAYKQSEPLKNWESKMVSFGFLYSRVTDSVFYLNNSPSLTEGQILYVQLKLLKGLYKLATSFEVVTIDDENHIIQFSYIHGGKNSGLQTLQLFETKKGQTKILHTTLYKSGSFVRDRILYKPFHRRSIALFHKNVKKELKSVHWGMIQ